MPYTKKQCRAFGAKSGRGESVPADWKEHCRLPDNRKKKRKTKRKRS